MEVQEETALKLSYINWGKYPIFI